VPQVGGAVYKPCASTLPPALPSATDHVTDVSAAFFTVATKRAVAPYASWSWSGAIVIETASGVAVTVTSAVADFDGSAWLVAVTWYVPAAFGAV